MLASDKWVWLPHDELVWTPAAVIKNNGSYTKYKTHQGEEITIQNNRVDVATLEAVSQASKEGLVSNLVNLDEMGEGAVIHALRCRYNNDEIYTNIGPILVSINPYKQLPIYSASTIAKYPPSSSSHNSTAPPHVFAIASAAYHQLMTLHEDQAIIISGESGAGKTEATKTVLSYLSEITNKHRDEEESTTSASTTTSTPQQILLSNPILESFGNSKTLRNNNSSRFGKYMQINISLKTGQIISARIFNYLLEKSRVTQLTQNERNYHIFYQLCTGLDPAEKQRVGLGEVSDYAYLSQSNCLTIEGVNDAREWAVTLDALQQLNFSSEDISTIINILTAILQLGNIQFTATRINNMDATEIQDPALLQQTAKNLSMSAEELSMAIRYRCVTIRGETSNIPLNMLETVDSRDALSKALYDRLFNWIVDRLNHSLMKNSQQQACNNNNNDKYKSIGILDIFGFEIFQQNLFEQFCINYANEKLQQHFNTHIFKLEKEVYMEEQIVFDENTIDFIDNLECVNLIENKQGIIKSMEEEIMLPQGNDKSMIEKMHNKYYGKNKYYDIQKKSPNLFIIKHYAGDVAYDSQGMLNKNKDKLHEILDTSIRKSSNGKIVEMWENLEKMEVARQREMAALQAELDASSNNSGNSNNNKNKTSIANGTMGGSANKKKVFSLGTQFSQQLQLLMSILNACAPHYIRCVKPNFVKKNNRFDSHLVMTQLSYAGLFNAIKVRKSGFAYRKIYLDFLKEYRILMNINELNQMKTQTTPKSQCQYLITQVLANKIIAGEYQFGVSKIFMRNPQRVILGELKNIALTAKTILLQSAFRGVIARRKVKALKAFAVECRVLLQQQDLRIQKEKLKSLLELAAKKKYQLFVMKQMKISLEFFVEEDRVEEIIKEALTPPLSIALLSSALDTYTKLTSKTPSFLKIQQTLVQQHGRVVAEHKRMSSIEEKRKVLREAMIEENSAQLQEVLNELSDLNMDTNDSDWMSAQALLQQWAEEEAKWEALRAAINSKDADAIESAVDTVRKLTRTDENKLQLIQKARDTLMTIYKGLLDAAILQADDEHTVRKKLMPKLEQLQFVDLVYQAQGWLDEQDRLRVMEKQRRASQSSAGAGDSSAGGTIPDAPSMEDDAVTRQHKEEKEKRLNNMNKISAIQKRRSVASQEESLPPPPPGDDSIPPPPPPADTEAPDQFNPDLEEFFPPPPPSDGETRDQSLTLAMHYKDYATLASLLSQCRAVNHNSRILRMSENVLKQWNEEEKIRDMIVKIRDDGWQDEDAIKEVIKKAGLIGMNDAAEIKELRYIVYTMTDVERLEMRLQYARERENIPLLLYLLGEANEQEIDSEKTNEIRCELERMGVSGGESYGRGKGTKGGKEENQQERYKRFMDTYGATNNTATANGREGSATASPYSALSLPLSLSAFPFLRRANNYAKHSILHKDKVMKNMLVHQKDDIPTSLLFLSTAHCQGNRKESIRLKNLAKNMFKNIKGYMGDAYHPYPVSLAYEVVMTGVNESMLRDEIFCQIIKQTTHNPHQASLLLGFKLMYLCLSTFSPSVSLSPFILSHLAIFALSSLPAEHVRYSSVDEVATNCWLVWEAGEREREARERDLAERREKGEAIDEKRLKEQDRARMKVPSMQEVERLTMGTIEEDVEKETPATPSTSNSRFGQNIRSASASPRGTATPGMLSSSLSRPLTLGTPSYAHTLSVSIPVVTNATPPSPSSRSPFSSQSKTSTLRSPSSIPPPPLNTRMSATSATGNETNVTYNYAPPSPSPSSAQHMTEDEDSTPRHAPPSPTTKVASGKPPASPPPPPSSSPSASPPPLAAPSALSTVNRQLSPRSAPPSSPQRNVNSASVPSSPAVDPSPPPSSVPAPPPLLSTTITTSTRTTTSKKGPPPMPVQQKAKIQSAPVAPAPPADVPAAPPLAPPALPAPAAGPSVGPAIVKKGPPALPVTTKKGPPPLTKLATPPPPPPVVAADAGDDADDNDGGDRDALLQAIRKGKKMRRVGPPLEKPLKERLGM